MRAARRPVVRFGRRKGQNREVMSNDEDDIVEGIFLPEGVGLHQITILPKAEWQRIQDSLTAHARETARILAERKARKDLHLKSQALVNNWTNTIAGMSQQKLKTKKVRQQKMEEEKRKVDLEEAKYQAQKRKEKIEEAKLQQYYQNERVKGFHRALLLTEVLKERDAQIEFNKKKANLYQSKNKEIECEHLKAVKLEEEKAKTAHMKRMQINKDQLEQIKEHEHLANVHKLEEKKEREEIEALTKLYQREMQEKEQKEHEEKMKRKKEHLEHVADQITLKEIEKQKQEEEDDNIRMHVKTKQAMNKLRRAKEDEMNRLMEEKRERIVNRLLAHMKKKSEDEDETIARAIAETEADQARELKAKEEKLQADLKSIAEYRISTMRRKEEQEKQAKLEAEEMLHNMLEADRIYQELEKDKQFRFHCANLKLQETHIMQIAEKKEKEQIEKQQDDEYVHQREVIALYKEREFQKYAKNIIDEESKTSRNLYPLLQSMNKNVTTFSHSASSDSPESNGKCATQFPHRDGTVQEVKQLNNQEFGHAKSRLGFTW